MREKLASCVLYAWSDASGKCAFGPTFLREDTGVDSIILPETANELALVHAFLSIADLAQLESSKLTQAGRFYNNTRVQEESARKKLIAEALSQQSEILQLESSSSEETSTKKRRIELKPDHAEIPTRLDIVEDEHKNRSHIQKQMRLAFRLFDPRVETNPCAKEARTEVLTAVKK
jgi:hypothetical protein